MAILKHNIMSFWSFVKKEISRISNIKNLEKAMKELKELDRKVNGPKIKTRERGNYIYFYVMDVFYDPSVREGRRKIKEKLGKISIEKYKINKNKIALMSKSELKKYLEQY